MRLSGGATIVAGSLTTVSYGTYLWGLHYPSNFRLKDPSHVCRNRLRPQRSGGPA